jgi:hypothetical protein
MSSTITYAEQYLARGWSPIPLEPGQKRPALPGWQHLRLAKADLAGHFSGGQNVGLLLGDPSGGLVDVDLDSPRARELAPEFLPPTGLMSGRKSSPRSHWWYRVSEPIETIQLRGVELRSTGVQTVVPPSRHPSGELYEWHEFGKPSEATPDELIAAVYDLAQAAAPTVWTSRPSVPVCKKKSDGPVPPFLLSPGDINKHLWNRVWGILHYQGRKRPSVQGEKGSHALVAAALPVVRGFCTDLEAALKFLGIWNRTYATPPWDEDELVRRIEYVSDYGAMPWCKHLANSQYPDSLTPRAAELREWALSLQTPPAPAPVPLPA